MIFRSPLFASEIEIDDPRPGALVHLPWLLCGPMPCGDPTHCGEVLEVKRDESAAGVTTHIALSIMGQAPGLPIRNEAFTTHWSHRP